MTSRQPTLSSTSGPSSPLEAQMGPGEEEALATLRDRFPQAVTAELLRFARARRHSPAEACKMYQAHLEWRHGPGFSEQLEEAARVVPARYIRAAGVARDGSPLLVVQGGRFDPSVDPEQYVLAIAKMLFERLPPEDMTKVTVLLDVRPGNGWVNVPFHKQLPLFRAVSGVLPNHFPERAQRIIVYPMPDIVEHLWRMCSRMLDQVTRDKLVMLAGSAAPNAPCPDRLGDYVALDQLPMDVQALHQALASGPGLSRS